MEWSSPLVFKWPLSSHDYNAIKGVGVNNSNTSEITGDCTERIHRAQEEKDFFVAATIFPVTLLPAIFAYIQHLYATSSFLSYAVEFSV